MSRKVYLFTSATGRGLVVSVVYNWPNRIMSTETLKYLDMIYYINLRII